tara:strand:+ start:1035 stop:2108 length:1074 start_codon:yes stop_codon:yes gene_type:complete
MTIVKGKIESLKRVKTQLNQKGIKQFNSIGSINSFLRNYESEKKNIYTQAASELNIELENLTNEKPKLQIKLERSKTKEISSLSDKIEYLETKYNFIDSKESNAIITTFNFFQLIFLKSKKNRLKKNFDKIIFNKTFKLSNRVEKVNDLIYEYKTNKEEIIHNRSRQKVSELDYTKKVIDELYKDIAGAIGENLVVKELKKLSDRNILINDFSVDFRPPIYNKKEQDKIFSIQIDHLLITNSGIFIIETKNWSKKSIENFNLKSPIKQIKRTSYALFVILNSNSKKSNTLLKKHHWGDKKVPIRNLIVMINNKPREKFKFVEVKTLNELNRYVSYFEPILDDSEVKNIATALETICN